MTDRTVRGVATAIESGELTPTEALDRCLREIETQNPQINAVVSINEDRARSAIDRGLPTGPLHGVPLLVKDLHAEVAGLPLSRGSHCFAGESHDESSQLIERLEAAGAVVVGRTNTPELGLNITTEPQLWGPCRNPHNLRYSCGGSSGGSAAAVASGMVPAAHGSDSGGSLRIPASWCGVVGFKPTRGLIPHGPHRTNPWEGLSHEHAITKTVADSRLLLEVGGALRLSEVTATRLGISVVRDGPSPVDPACLAAVDEAAALLSTLGHCVSKRSYPEPARHIGPVVQKIIGAHVAAATADRDRALLELPSRDLAALGDAMSASDLIEQRGQLAQLTEKLIADMGDDDLWLLPVTAAQAPVLGYLHTDRTADELFAEILAIAPFTMMFNITGGPAISIPWSIAHNGTAIGVQVAGRPGDDALVLEVAEILMSRRG